MRLEGENDLNSRLRIVDTQPGEIAGVEVEELMSQSVIGRLGPIISISPERW
jgi:hypothetical protein